MFKKTTIDLKTSGTLNPLMLDYIKQEKSLRSFYSFFPDKKGYEGLLKTKPYENFKRSELSGILKKQSQQVVNTSESSLQNIQSLEQSNTFTVTTGHQLCLFTGPLYFIYKILSTINLAENLKNEFPEFNFVPAYWMASEDHDFEEVSSFNAFGKTIKWMSEQSGAVGDFKTGELKKLVSEIDALFGRSEHADYLKTLFEKAYLGHRNLADATRYIVNQLFGDYGLVIVDGNDRALKTQFKEQFKKDIFENQAFNLSAPSIKTLHDQGYHIQVNPRPINCFYIENGLRVRLEKEKERYLLVGTDRSFSKEELEEIIEKTPEKISPNVVLRPLYQQVILPNLAYIGGPGELAYWLEFKELFDGFQVMFPVLAPRNFVTLVDRATEVRMEKLKLSVADLFKTETELIKDLQIKTNSFFQLEGETKTLSDLYHSLHEKLIAIDKTLEGSVSAELKRSLNGFDRLSQKANRALRKDLDTEINRIKQIKAVLFPHQTPQERYENFSAFYLSHGKELIKSLKEHLNPLALEYTVLTTE